MTVRFRTFPSAAGIALTAVLLIVQTGCSQSAEPMMHAKVLQSGAPIADAIIVLTQSKRPFFGSLFSSADPSRCVKLGFVKTDASGGFTPIQGTYPTALVAPGFVGLSQVDTMVDQGAFVLREQSLQSSENSEQFGPEYPSEADANKARLSFLASAEGQNYTAFTVQPPNSGFKNFRMLVVKYIEVARSKPFKTQVEADAALDRSAFAIAGGFDADAVLQTLARCHAAKISQPELGVTVLRAIEAALPVAKRSSQQSEYLQYFAKQVGVTL